MEHEENIVGGNDTEADSAGDVGDKSTKSLGRYGKKTAGGEQNLGKEWIDMVEGIALFFDQALPVNLLFAQERGQYGSLRRQILAQRRNSAAARAASVTLKNDCGVAKGTIQQKNEDPEHSTSPPPADRGTALSESSAEAESRRRTTSYRSACLRFTAVNTSCASSIAFLESWPSLRR